jgi:hypothetical protein
MVSCDSSELIMMVSCDSDDLMVRLDSSELMVRLDSGDLATLSRQTRALLDEAGLGSTKIYASNDLDEHAIAALLAAGAPIDVFGVGTRLVTGGEQSALGGVYKLTSVKEGERFVPRVKKSEDPTKVSWPGRLEVERFTRGDGTTCDVLFDRDEDAAWSGALLDATTGAALENDPAVEEGHDRLEDAAHGEGVLGAGRHVHRQHRPLRVVHDHEALGRARSGRARARGHESQRGERRRGPRAAKEASTIDLHRAPPCPSVVDSSGTGAHVKASVSTTSAASWRRLPPLAANRSVRARRAHASASSAGRPTAYSNQRRT